MIPISLAIEDDLSEAVLRKILNEREIVYHVGLVFKKNGFGYLKKSCSAFNNMAKASPVLLLTDLDQNPCPPALIDDWLSQPRHPRFLFRIAIHEVEAWLLAHDKALQKFLGLRRNLHYPTPEILLDPKAELLKIAVLSPRREIREDLTRRDYGGNLKQGPAYNSTLTAFVNSLSSFAAVADKCSSLCRLLKSLQALEDTYARELDP